MRNVAAVGDGHSAIVPRMSRAVATRVEFLLTVSETTREPWDVAQMYPRVRCKTSHSTRVPLAALEVGPDWEYWEA